MTFLPSRGVPRDLLCQVLGCPSGPPSAAVPAVPVSPVPHASPVTSMRLASLSACAQGRCVLRVASGYDHGFGCRLLFGFIPIHFCRLTVGFGPRSGPLLFLFSYLLSTRLRAHCVPVVALLSKKILPIAVFLSRPLKMLTCALGVGSKLTPPCTARARAALAAGGVTG